MAYHIVIAKERRTAVSRPMLGLDFSRLAHNSGDALYVCNDSLRTIDGMPHVERGGAFEPLALQKNPQFVGVFEWDLKSPYVIVHKGDYVPRFFGWPELTKEQFDSAEVLKGRT